MAAVRQGAALGGDEPNALEEENEYEDAPATLPEHLLRGNVEEATVVLCKETDTTRIGIGLRADIPERAVVNTVAAGSPAAQPAVPGSQAALIQPYDELIEVAGVRVESAVQAVKLIREAPAGELVMRKIACPPDVLRGVLMLQDTWRSTFARQEGVVRRVLFKPTLTTMLGLSFSPEFMVHSVLKKVNEDGIAARALEAGDRVVRINGVFCGNPGQTARMLRECEGRIEMHIVPSDSVDEEELHKVEEAHAVAMQLEEEREREQQGPYPYEDESDGEDGYGYVEEDAEQQDDDNAHGDERYGPRVANGSAGADPDSNDPFPSGSARPANVSSHARRLPPSLANLSPGGPDSAGDAFGPKTSSTRSTGPPVASKKPEGWREWLQQRRSAAAVQPKDPPEPPPTNQRV